MSYDIEKAIKKEVEKQVEKQMKKKAWKAICDETCLEHGAIKALITDTIKTIGTMIHKRIEAHCEGDAHLDAYEISKIVDPMINHHAKMFCHYDADEIGDVASDYVKDAIMAHYEESAHYETDVIERLIDKRIHEHCRTTPHITEQKVNRLLREESEKPLEVHCVMKTVEFEEPITGSCDNYAPKRGDNWDESDEEKLAEDLDHFIKHHSNTLGRTYLGIKYRIKKLFNDGTC